MFPTPTHHKYFSSIPSHELGDPNILSSSDILFGTTKTDDAKWNDEMEALLLDTSLHTILALPDNDQDDYSSIEQQLSTLEKESNNFFETLKKKELSLLPQEEQGSDQHDGSSTVSCKAEKDTPMQYEECCGISLGSKESTISSKSDDKRIHSFSFDTDYDLSSETEEGTTTQEECFSELFATNIISEVFHFVDATKGDNKHNEKKSPLDSILVHSFVKEYEIRAKDLRACMNRTKSSRSKVAKVKQYMKKRYLQKCSSSRSSKLEGIEAVPDFTKTSDGQPSSLQELFTSHQM
ncbi:predicted protein [Chaetoceros tenuissimus]|uniref:Uncharacterized protein n=1 Tax=Chaetoceros tenuissimus TaxID=426638 RepID=A0AAD3CE96_9STRA|nr:predicted protein [Chaetoceros tenuissimus]